MAGYGGREAHHAVPRCLVSLHERAHVSSEIDGEGIQAWLEWEWEAARWRVPVEISRGELEALVEASEVVLGRDEHRRAHAGDWRRWARGGRETLRRYGRQWFGLLALRWWGRISAAELHAAKVPSGDRAGVPPDGPRIVSYGGSGA